MDALPTLMVRPSPRCFHRPSLFFRPVCGKPADWERPCGEVGVIAFFCDEHRSASDRPISPTLVYRQVSVQLEVLLSGTSWNQVEAESEALALVIDAVQGIGGIPSLWTVRSLIGRYRAPRPVKAAPAAPAKEQ